MATSLSSQHPATSLMSFDAAERHNKGLSDDFIVNVLTDNLEGAPGVASHSTVKSFLDHVPEDAADLEFCQDHGSVATFHDQLADLIANNLQVACSSSVTVATKVHVSLAKDRFVARVHEGKGPVRQYLHEWALWDGDISKPGRDRAYALGLFRKQFGDLCAKEGVNPRNPSFNAPPAIADMGAVAHMLQREKWGPCVASPL